MDSFVANNVDVITNNTENHLAPASTTAAPPNGRFYKSRKSRPCDACRRRKVTCHMPAGPPCQRCRTKDQACAFEQGPGKRKRPVRNAVSPVPAPATSISETVPEPAEFWTTDCPVPHTGYTPNNFPYDDTGDIDALWATCDIIAPELSLFGRGSEIQASPAQSSSLDNTRRTPLSGHLSPADSLSDRGASQARSSGSLEPVHTPLHSTRPAIEESYTTTRSLEVLPESFSFYIGPTGVSDCLLLQKEAYGEGDVAPTSVKGLQYRRVSSGGISHINYANDAVLFGITDHALIENAEPKADSSAIEEAWAALWKMIDASAAWSLIKLYTRFVDPYFPIVASCQLPVSGADGLKTRSISLALLSAMCAAALPFVVHDRTLYPLLLRPPSSDQLYRLCWLGITQELHAPTLGTLQACLLLQQRLPANLYLHDTAFAWSLMATAVSVAQTLGLHREPSGWTGVPAWERRLRRRLWWTLWSTEKWVALARGMPSHLAPAGADDENSDVESLCHADTAPGDNLSREIVDVGRQPHLLYLVRLTTILADIQRSYYTLRATRRTSQHLALAMDIGRPLRARLQSWRESLPAGLRFRSRDQPFKETSQGRSTTCIDMDESRITEHHQKLDGNASLHLSYIVTHMMLFRALLRPLDSVGDESDSSDSNTDVLNHAVTKGSLLCVGEFVEFVEALSPTQWNAFWHGWSRANFAMAGSFMVYLLRIITSPAGDARPGFQDEYRELMSWIRRWRWASRVSVNGAAGAKGLTNLMLLRVETFLGALGGQNTSAN